jgi:hypothetical protein
LFIYSGTMKRAFAINELDEFLESSNIYVIPNQKEESTDNASIIIDKYAIEKNNPKRTTLFFKMIGLKGTGKPKI